MATHELTSENLESTIKDNDIIIMDFWADWCGPCKMFGPIFEKASLKYPDIKFMKCNTEKQQEVAGSFGVRSIPTLAVFRNQILLYKEAGALPEPALEELITKILEIDMDDVQKEVEAQKAKEAKEESK
jgi:thioredoxin